MRILFSSCVTSVESDLPWALRCPTPPPSPRFPTHLRRAGESDFRPPPPSCFVGFLLLSGICLCLRLWPRLSLRLFLVIEFLLVRSCLG